MNERRAALHRLKERLRPGALRGVLEDAIAFLDGDERPLTERVLTVINYDGCENCGPR